MRLVPSHPRRSAPRDLASGDLASALARSVRTPVEALRIVLEDVERGSASSRAVPAAVDALARLSHSVRAIEDYFLPRAGAALACSLPEIVGGVRGSLPQTFRERLEVEVDGAPDKLFVDGPTLVKCLVRLVENALEAQPEAAVLRISCAGTGEKGACCTFTVIDQGEAPFDFDLAVEPFQSTRRGHVGLGLTLAARDIARMGGELRCSEPAGGGHALVVALDVSSTKNKEAA